MSNLAYYFLANKWAVSGSDLTASSTTEELRRARIKVRIGHRRTNLPRDCNLVVYSQAVSKRNSELKEAGRRGIPAIPYPEMLGRLTKSYKTLAVAGAHGKSTTASLLALVLRNGGLNPTVIVGTKLKEFGGRGFHNGKSDYLVIEADEYGGAFLHYSPTLAIITNIDLEHLDFYRNLSGVKRAFWGFAKNVKPGGVLVLNRDDKNLRSLKIPDLKIVWYSLRDPEAKKIREHLFIPGEHNVANALAVYRAARLLGIPEKKILEVFEKYRGSWRRMEYKGELKIQNSKVKTELKIQNSKIKAYVYDDYAHHPTEIRATLQAFREKYPKSRIVCVFQPHQAKRLKALFREFQTAFDTADITLVLPLYRVAGRDKSGLGFDSAALVKAIQKKQPQKRIFYLANPKNLKKTIKALLLPAPHRLPPAVIVMMGAGNIADFTNSILSGENRLSRQRGGRAPLGSYGD